GPVAAPTGPGGACATLVFHPLLPPSPGFVTPVPAPPGAARRTTGAPGRRPPAPPTTGYLRMGSRRRPPPPPTTTAEFLAALRAVGLLSPGRARRLLARWGPTGDPRRRARALVRAGLLTD